MRFGFLIAVSFTLAACDSGTVPSPLERQQAGEVAVLVPENGSVTLDGQGLTLGDVRYYFSAEQAMMERMLSKEIGSPTAAGVHKECGGGPIEYMQYDSGLSVHYSEGYLVGWQTTDHSGQVRVAGDVQVGTSRAKAKTARGFTLIKENDLGAEFALGSQMGGFVMGDRVFLLYAGTQCFFR